LNPFNRNTESVAVSLQNVDQPDMSVWIRCRVLLILAFDVGREAGLISAFKSAAGAIRFLITGLAVTSFIGCSLRLCKRTAS